MALKKTPHVLVLPIRSCLHEQNCGGGGGVKKGVTLTQIFQAR